MYNGQRQLTWRNGEGCAISQLRWILLDQSNASWLTVTSCNQPDDEKMTHWILVNQTKTKQPR